MKILIVDDDYVDREFLKKNLKRAINDCEVIEAQNVDDALEEYKKQKFDVVLLDYRMPQKDGIELVKELRANAPESSVAIIMLSNSEQEELALACVKAGAQDFLLKSDLSAARLHRAVVQAKNRFELEQKLYTSYREVKQLAEYDSLTGLANRHLFEETLKSNILNNADNDNIALLVIDIDHFKFVNDNHGHETGDILLNRIVNRVFSCLRGSELFARIGSDEFAIIITNLNSIDIASKIAQRILRVLEKPFKISDTIIKITSSIGISLFPENTETAGELLKFANIAMHQAKQNGRNQVFFFEEQMQREFFQRYRIENDLRRAIENQEFLLFYQPVYSPETSELYGFEVLIRWQHNDEMRMPENFIPIAEESGLIIEIGRWVIKESLSKLAYWNKRGFKELKMSINLSAIQLRDDSLPYFINQHITENEVDPTKVEFELTETAFIKESDETSNIITDITKLGCHIALDDFGTGFSSLTHLQNLPINTVKIDRSLLMLSAQPKTMALIKGLSLMLQSIGIDVVAEGVETKQSLELCNNLNINRIQGFYYSKPLNSLDFEKHILKIKIA